MIQTVHQFVFLNASLPLEGNCLEIFLSTVNWMYISVLITLPMLILNSIYYLNALECLFKYCQLNVYFTLKYCQLNV